MDKLLVIDVEDARHVFAVFSEVGVILISAKFNKSVIY